MINIVSIFVTAFFTYNIQALTVGSNTTVSRQATPSFSGSPNTMLGFAAFANGFTIADANTSCSYDNFFRISGNIKLNNGKLFLQQDLVLTNTTPFQNGGKIFGALHSILLPENTNSFSFPRTNGMIFDNTTIVCRSNLVVAGDMIFGNSCKIIGTQNNKVLTMGTDRRIFVRPGGNLTFENIQLSGVKTGNLVCMNDSASITLNNAQMQLSSNYTFSRGSIFFDRDCSISGTSKFTYNSVMTSTIGTQSSLTLDRDTTFSYDPGNNKNSLLNFKSKTSKLILRDCSMVSTRTGMLLSNGTLFVDGNVTLSAQGRNRVEGIKLGNDLNINVLGASTLNLFGHFSFVRTPLVADNASSFIVTLITTTQTNRQINMVDWQRSYSNVCIAMRGGYTIQHFNPGTGTLSQVGTGALGTNVMSIRTSRLSSAEPIIYDNGGTTAPVGGSSNRLTANDTIITSASVIVTNTAYYSFHTTLAVDNGSNYITYYSSSANQANLAYYQPSIPSTIYTFDIFPTPILTVNPHTFTLEPHSRDNKIYSCGKHRPSAGGYLTRKYNSGTNVYASLITFSVTAIEWNPTGTYVAVAGHRGGIPVDNIRIYQFDYFTFNPALISNVLPTPLRKNVQSIAWSSDGNFLAAGIEDGTNSVIKIYAFDKTNVKLTLMNDITPYTPTNIASLRWSTDAAYPYLIVGLQDGNVSVYQMDAIEFQ